MQTLDEFAWLVRNAVGLWRRHLPVLVAWLAGGWAVREICFHVAVLLGPNRVAAMVCFALGMVVWVVSIIGMLYTVTRRPLAFDELAASTGAPPIAPRRWRDVMVDAVVPFLAIYAVWGLTEEQVQRAFTANLTYWGLDAANFSISFSDWRLYLVVTVAAWALQAAVGFLARGRRRGVVVSLVLTFLRGVAILTAFLGLDTLGKTTLGWFRGRQLWKWMTGAWDALVGALPGWQLPFDITLPDLVRDAGNFVWHGLLPGMFATVLLPLLWLALTATEVGWRDFTGGVARSRFAAVLDAVTDRARESSQRATQSRDLGPLGVGRRVVAGQLEPVLPIVEAFRLILRAGLPLLGAYLVLAAAVRSLSSWLNDAVLWLIGPNSPAVTLRYSSVVELFAELVAWPLAVCVYASAFDRALLLTLRRGSAVSAEPDGLSGAEPDSHARAVEG